MSKILDYDREALKATVGIRREHNVAHKREQWAILVQNTSAKKEEIFRYLETLPIYNFIIAEEKIPLNEEFVHHHIYISDGDQSQDEIIELIKKIYESEFRVYNLSDIRVFVIIKLVKYLAYLETIDDKIMEFTISSVRELELFDEAMDAINAQNKQYLEDKRKEREDKDKEDYENDFSNLFL